MANRRMFSLDVTDTDKFLDLPHHAQLLYYHLGMRADDDGFIGVAKRLCRLLNIDESNLDILVNENFLYKFDDGVYVIVHWKLSNCIKRDRYKTTTYQEDFKTLAVAENGEYIFAEPDWNQTGTKTEPQDRLGKDRIDKDRIGEGEDSEKESAAPAPSLNTNIKNNSYKTFGEFSNVILSGPEIDALSCEYPDKYKEYIEKLSSYIASTGKEYSSHFATIKRWLTEDTAKSKAKPKKSYLNNYKDTNCPDYSALEEELLDSFLDDDTA